MKIILKTIIMLVFFPFIVGVVLLWSPLILFEEIAEIYIKLYDRLTKGQ